MLPAQKPPCKTKKKNIHDNYDPRKPKAIKAAKAVLKAKQKQRFCHSGSFKEKKLCNGLRGTQERIQDFHSQTTESKLCQIQP